MSSAATRSAIQRSRLYQQQFNLPDDEMLVDGQKAHTHKAREQEEGGERTDGETIEWRGGLHIGCTVSAAQWERSR